MAKKAILVAGLGRFAPTPAVPDILAKVQSDLKKVQDAGFETQDLELNPQDQADAIKQVRDALEGKKFDGFVIGYGLRGMKDFTELFEAVINCSREVSPGTKFLFSTKPDGIMEAVERGFGTGQ